MDFKKLSQEEAFEQAREEGLKLPEDAAIEAKNKKKAEKAAKKHGDSRARKAARHGNLADFIVEHNKGIRNVVIVLVVFFAICFPFVEVNYDLTKYLPDTEGENAGTTAESADGK